MNVDRDSGLGRIWPEVRAEIESARRWRNRKRKAARIGAALCLLVTTASLAVWGFRLAAPRPEAFHSWQLGDISTATGICADYPPVRGERLYVVLGDGDHQHVACLDRRTGARLWTSVVSFSQCRLAADDQRVYVLAQGHRRQWRCVALEAGSGATLWQESVGAIRAGLLSHLTVLRNGLCWSEGNRVVMREPATGRLLWNQMVGLGGLLAAPVRQGDTLYTASADQFYALDPRTGGILWSRPLSDHTSLAGFTRPTLEAGAGRIFCAARDRPGKGVLLCIGTGTREVLWRQATEAPTKLHSHVNRVFVRSANLTALDAGTGRPLWRVPVGGCGTLSFHGQRIYLVDTAERGRVLALDEATGKQVWTHTVAGSCNGIIVSDRVGILSGNDRTLYAFALDRKS